MQNIKLHFVSLDQQFLIAIHEKFKNTFVNIEYTYGSIDTISHINTAFISPTNSYGDMNYGVDNVYNNSMFFGIEKLVKDKIKSIGKYTNMGNYFLKVGNAIITATNNMISNNTILITAPTMFVKQDVSNTYNAYYSYLASLMVLKKYLLSNKNSAIITLVCPALCCNSGKMSYEKCATQIYEAYYNFINNNVPNDLSDDDTILLIDSYIIFKHSNSQLINETNKKRRMIL